MATKLDGNIQGEVKIIRSGEQIVLPEKMSFAEGIEWLKRRLAEDEQDIRVNEVIEVHPLEGSYALARALSKKFGWVGLIPTPGFWGDNPPTQIAFEVDINKVEQVPWGRIQIPGVSGYVQTEIEVKDGRFLFRLGGVIKQKSKHVIAELMVLARKIAYEESIYRGKAIRTNFPPPSEDFNIRDNWPKFLDVMHVKEDELIFSEETAKIVQDSIFTPVTKTK